MTSLCLPADEDSSVRRLKTHYLDKTDKYWLSSYNYTGKEHSENSRYYSLWPDEKQAETYTSDVLKRGADGCFVVKLRTGLQWKDVKENQSSDPEPSGNTRKRQRYPAMMLTGLLHLLWEQSGINT